MPVLEGRVSQYTIDRLLECGQSEGNEHCAGQVLRQGRYGLPGVAFLKARLLHIFLVVRALLGLDLGGSVSRSILLG